MGAIGTYGGFLLWALVLALPIVVVIVLAYIRSRSTGGQGQMTTRPVPPPELHDERLKVENTRVKDTPRRTGS